MRGENSPKGIEAICGVNWGNSKPIEADKIQALKRLRKNPKHIEAMKSQHWGELWGQLRNPKRIEAIKFKHWGHWGNPKRIEAMKSRHWSEWWGELRNSKRTEAMESKHWGDEIPVLRRYEASCVTDWRYRGELWGRLKVLMHAVRPTEGIEANCETDWGILKGIDTQWNELWGLRRLFSRLSLIEGFWVIIGYRYWQIIPRRRRKPREIDVVAKEQASNVRFTVGECLKLVRPVVTSLLWVILDPTRAIPSSGEGGVPPWTKNIER